MSQFAVPPQSMPGPEVFEILASLCGCRIDAGEVALGLKGVSIVYAGEVASTSRIGVFEPCPGYLSIFLVDGEGKVVERSL